MAFLSYNPSKGSVAVGKTVTAAQTSKTGDAKSDGKSNSASSSISMWSVFQDPGANESKDANANASANAKQNPDDSNAASSASASALTSMWNVFQDPKTAASAPSKTEDAKDSNAASASMWTVFQDRLLQKDNSETSAKDSATTKTKTTTTPAKPKSKSNSISSFFLNEELKRVESKATSNARRSSSSSFSMPLTVEEDEPKDNVLLLSQDDIQELELQEGSLPDRWLDFFCIVGLDPSASLAKEDDGASASTNTNTNTSTTVPPNKPVLLDRYPKDDRPDMDFPEHLSTFCFPNGGCRPLRYKRRQHRDSNTKPSSSKKNNNKNKNKKKKETIDIKYHHNAPDPYMCGMVLTSGSGHRLYCTSLTVYEMREEGNQKVQEKEKEQEKEKLPAVPKQEAEAAAPKPSPKSKFNEHWWEEPDIETMSKNIENTRAAKAAKSAATTTTTTTAVSTIAKAEDEDDVYYWIVPKCLVLISHYPFFQAQSMALKELFYTVQSGVSPVPFERYIANLVDDVPLPRCGIGRQQHSEGQQISSSSRSSSSSSCMMSQSRSNQRSYTVVECRPWTKQRVRRSGLGSKPKLPPAIRLERPPPNRLPLLNVSMEPLFRTLSLSNILVIWANLLQEGKIVLACSQTETAALLAPIGEALLALLFPLEWQGIYVPVLPNHDSVLDVLEAPVPYLIGLVTKAQSYNPRSHPSGVLWCDLDNDALHLGFKGEQLFYNQCNNPDGEEIPMLPALPAEASMTLKAELEEIADPLYLPTVEGIKGRITVGDRTIEMDNALRQPYAQRTKLFDKPTATPRKYILTQSSKIPPRGTVLKYEDFSIVPETTATATATADPKASTTPSVGTASTDEDEVAICGMTLDDIQIPCGEDTTFIDLFPIGQAPDQKKEEGIVPPDPKANGNAKTKTKAKTNSKATKEESNSKEKPKFLVSFKRQSRSMQAHVDRAMAVLGQDYATPSQYATQSRKQFGEDVLSKQDEIAARFFSVDPSETKTVTEPVRESFLRFFLVTFARYKFYFDPETNRLDEDRFVASLNMSYRQREFVREVVTSQMFEVFMEDTRSIRHRKLFDEYVIKHRNGTFGVDGHQESNSKSKQTSKSTPKSNRSFGTPLLDSSQWKSPTIVVPEPPCRVGLKEGRVYCHDRRFPDSLDPEECITNQNVSFWKLFWDSAFCSPFSSCT